MKLYSEDEQREVWNKQKSKGKKRFVVSGAIIFTASIVIPLIIMYMLLNYLFNALNYGFVGTILMFAIFTIMGITIGLKSSAKVWDKRKIKFDGIAGVVAEINDNELKNLILKGEKIMAAKRYRIITGAGIKESLRYVDLISEYYSLNVS